MPAGNERPVRAGTVRRHGRERAILALWMWQRRLALQFSRLSACAPPGAAWCALAAPPPRISSAPLRDQNPLWPRTLRLSQMPLLRWAFETAARPRERPCRSCSVSTRAAAVAAAARALLRFVHLQRASAEISAVQCLNGSCRIRIRHLDEPESTRTSGVAIGDQRYLLDRAVIGEQGANGLVSRRKGKISNV